MSDLYRSSVTETQRAQKIPPKGYGGRNSPPFFKEGCVSLCDGRGGKTS